MSISTSIRKDQFISLSMFINDLISVCFVIFEVYINTAMSDCVMTEVNHLNFVYSKAHP